MTILTEAVEIADKSDWLTVIASMMKYTRYQKIIMGGVISEQLSRTMFHDRPALRQKIGIELGISVSMMSDHVRAYQVAIKYKLSRDIIENTGVVVLYKAGVRAKGDRKQLLVEINSIREHKRQAKTNESNVKHLRFALTIEEREEVLACLAAYADTGDEAQGELLLRLVRANDA